MPPVGTSDPKRQYDTYDGKNQAAEDWIGYAFGAPVTFSRVVFEEGVHFPRGGWFETLTVHVRQNGLWTAVSRLTVTPTYVGSAGKSFSTYTFAFAPITGDAIRIWGRPGGKDAFVSIGELRVFGSSTTPAPPVATSTPTAAVTPVRTATATALPTVVPTIASTPRATATIAVQPTLAATAVPTVVATPSASSFTFPLDGWVAEKGGTSAVLDSDPEAGGARVLVVDDPHGTNAAVTYPERATLALPFSILSFTSRAGTQSELRVSVRAADGRTYVLAYPAEDGVPTASKREATFPTGAPASGYRSTLRDLAADLAAAFNVEFVAVVKASLRGPVRVADLTVAAPGVLPAPPVQAAELALPVDGWLQQGAGTVVENEYDADLAAPTIRTEPRDGKRARIAVSFPKKQVLVAAYRTFSLVVRDEQKLAIEVRVRVKRGIARLRYEAGIVEPVVKGRKTTLPLVGVPIESSPYRLVNIDLAGDVVRVVPGADLSGVLGVRVQGKFRIGDVVLREPIE
jgi:hypothetical protein